MPKRISFQLYSARKTQPWAGIFEHLAACGYKEVEGFGANYEDVAATRAALDANGLTMPTGHFSLDVLEKEPKKAAKIAASLGIRNIYCPHIMPDQRPKSGSGWKAFGKRLGAIAAALREEGYGFGWHNHDFEFRQLKDGSMPIDYIFEGGPMVDWEIDLAWVAFAKQNPVKWVKAYGERITAVHLKDNAPKGENLDQYGQTDVGKGTLKWPEIFKAVRDNTRCTSYVVEHDDPKDFKTFAKNSFNYLSKI